MYSNLWNERLQEIIEGFITGGIVNLHLERFTKSKWNLEKNDFETEKVVLNLSHLGFGFQICFFMTYAAFLVFLGELIVNWMKRRVKVNIIQGFRNIGRRMLIRLSRLSCRCKFTIPKLKLKLNYSRFKRNRLQKYSIKS